MSNGAKTKAAFSRRDFLTTATISSLSAVTGTPARSADETTSVRSASPVAATDVQKLVVGVYYYPWYDAPSETPEQDAPTIGWMRKTLRGRLKPKHWPKLGVYSSQHAETISDHIAQSKRGGVDFWAVSWWGPNHKTDRVFKNHILPHADAAKLKYALLYESTGRFGSFENPSYKRLLDDFEYMTEHYFEHPHYLKIEGRPAISKTRPDRRRETYSAQCSEKSRFRTSILSPATLSW